MFNRFLILCLALAGLFGGCRTVASGGPPGPVFLDAVVGVNGDAVAFVRSDPFKRLWLLGTRADAMVRVLDSATGIPVWTEHVGALRVFVYSADPPVHESFEPGALPSWAAQAFLQSELVIDNGVVTVPDYGLAFLPPQP